MKPLTYAEIQKMVSRVRKQAGNPPFVLRGWYGIPWYFRHAEGQDMIRLGCLFYHRFMAINPNQTKGNALNTIWHEIGHLVFPRKPHWWIECYAQRMSGRDYDGRAKMFFGARGPWTERAKKYHWMFGFPQAADLLAETRKRAARMRLPGRLRP